MKIVLINFDNNDSVAIQESCKDEVIYNKPNKILKINASTIIDNIERNDLIIILLNKETFNITSLLSILSIAKRDIEKVLLVIDVSDLTKEEEFLFDDIVEEITEFIFCMIMDDKSDLVPSVAEFIEKYKNV